MNAEEIKNAHGGNAVPYTVSTHGMSIDLGLLFNKDYGSDIREYDLYDLSSRPAPRIARIYVNEGGRRIVIEEFLQDADGVWRIGSGVSDEHLSPLAWDNTPWAWEAAMYQAMRDWLNKWLALPASHI